MKNTFMLLLSVCVMALTTSCKGVEGEKAAVSDAKEVKAATGVALPVNVSSSIVEWEGAKPTGTHTGTINLSSGTVNMEGKKITGGTFTMNMNTITNTDMKGEYKAKLEGHLKGMAEGTEDHFFNVAKYPTAKFDITKVVKLDGDDTATHMIFGNLEMKGVSKEVGFKALVGIGANRIEVTTPAFKIDRTLWGVNFKSGSVFNDLGDDFINDEIGLKITLKAGNAAI